MDIKEIALKVGLQVFEEHPYDKGHVVSPSDYTWIDDKLIEFAEAIIESYKAELLKEVGEPVGYLHQWIEYHPYGDTVAGEPCSAITNDGKPFDKSDTVTLLFTSDQVAAAIESYKAGLLKEVGEPVADGYFYRNPNGVCIECDPKHREEDGVFPLYTSDQLAAAIAKATKQMEEEVERLNQQSANRLIGLCKCGEDNDELRAQLAAAQEEVERLKGIKNVQLDIYPNDAGTKQQREVDGSLEMGQLLADSKNEETSNPKAERAKSLVWMHTGGGHIADSSGKRIGIFSGDFKHRDRLICAVNSESDILAQLSAAQEEIERYKASPTVETCRQMIESQAVKENKILFDQLAKAEQLWQVAQGRCDALEEKLAKAEQRVAEACALQVATETRFHWLDAARVAKEIRSGEWHKFVKEV